MKRTVTILAATVLVVCMCSSAFAENAPRLGSAGAQELRIPVSARMMAMAGASLVDAAGTDGLYWNPAGMVKATKSEIAVSHLSYIADISMSYLGIITHFDGIGTVGLSGKVLYAGEIPVTTEAQSNGTGEIFEPSFSVFGVHWARQFTDRITFGVSGHLINESIDRATASGASFDLGFHYDPQWEGLEFAVTMKNYGPDMRFGGAGFDRDVRVPGQDPGSPDKTIRQRSASFELPSYVQLGVSWDALSQEKSTLSLYGAYQSNTFNNDNGRLGMEYDFDKTLFLRGGYSYSDQDAYLYGVSFGGGLVVHWGETDLSIDYAWTETEVFDANQYFTLKMGF